MYTILDVADAILKEAKAKKISLTPLQLVKLAYIAHGFHLAIYGTGLFNNRIEAWKYGPVIPDLYYATKRFGRDPIPFDLIGDGSAELQAADVDFVKDVVNKYGELSGVELSNLTHRAGTPWRHVYQDGVLNIEIPNELIKSHYKKIVDDYRLSSATAAA